MESKKLVYLTDSIIPSSRAGAVHSVHQFNAIKQAYPNAVLVSQAGDMSWKQMGFTPIDLETVKPPEIKGGVFLLIRRFQKLLRRLKPDFIYSRFVLLPLCYSKAQYMVELHDDAWNKGFLFSKAIQKAVKSKKCLGFTAITKAIKIDFESQFPDATKSVYVLPDAAEVANERYTPQFNTNQQLTIGYVGSFYKGKGIATVLDIAQRMPQHHFLIIGGSEAQVIEVKAKYDLPNLEFTGFVPHSDIWQYMSRIDLCLLPNKQSVKTGKKADIGKYTSPLKMFEYMSFSKPIVASDLKVLKEVLTNESAILVPNDDIEAWIEAISSLENLDNRRALGENGYKLFLNQYTWEKRASKIIKLLIQ